MSYDNAPSELRALPQWILFDRKTKIPFCIDKTTKASPINPEHWTEYEKAVSATDESFGLGFVFLRGLTGIDIDHCFVDGALTPEAQELINTFDSYTELSPSGNGIHIICQGMIPGATGARKDGVEIYSRQRYFTFTGDVFEGRNTIQKRHSEIAALWHKLKGNRPQNNTVPDTQKIPEIAEDFDNRASAWIQANDYVGKVWEKGIELASQSDYDLQLVIEALDAGFNDAEAMKLVEIHRRKHGSNVLKAKRLDYRASTIAKAKEIIAARVAPSNVISLNGEAIDSVPDVFVDAVTIAHSPKPLHWLVRNYLPQTGIVWMAGEWSTLKTFLALDVAFHVATGMAWCGNDTHKGKVIYIAGEGFSGIGKRLKGLELHHKTLLSAQHILFTPLAVMLNEQKSFMELHRALTQFHPDPALIVIDTKSANMSGSDSDPAIMNNFINNLRLLEKSLNVLILVIDHVGHMSKDRPRGVSQQMGAADAIYMVERNKEANRVTLRTEKDPKDFPAPTMLQFQPEVVTLPSEWDIDGQASTTLVLIPHHTVDIPQPDRTNSGALKDAQRKAMDVLQELNASVAANLVAQGRPAEQVLIEIAFFRRALVERGICLRSHSYRMVASLADRGLIVLVGHNIHLVPDAWKN